MKKSKHWLLLSGLAMTFLLSLPIVSQAASQPDVAAKAAIAVDSQTGQILYQKNEQQTLPIASISKLLTVYIVHQQIEAGKLKWSDRIKISPAIARLSTASELTNVPLNEGQSYSVSELMNATMVASANAAAIALGNQVAGSPVKFQKKMQQTAQQLGIKHAQLYNAAGITNQQAGSLKLPQVAKNAENQMSAANVATVAVALIKQFPGITKISSQANLKFHGDSYPGHNKLLKGQEEAEPKLLVDGLKSGTSDAAGGSFVGTANKDHHRIVTVILHASNKSGDDPARYQQTAKIMKYVYQNMKPVTLAANSLVKHASRVAVVNGKQRFVKAQLVNKTQVWIDQTATTSAISGRLKLANNKKQIAAPIEANQKVGTVNLLVKQKPVKYLANSDAQLPVISNRSVTKLNVLEAFWRKITESF